MEAVACVFDAYGTLFDVHSAIRRYHTQLGPSADAISQMWRGKQLEYSWLRSLMRSHADFWEVTRQALDFTFEAFGVFDEALKQALLEAYLRLDCYPDVKGVLLQLKQRGFRCAILSNGSPAMLAAAVQSGSLAGLFERVISVEEAGTYKPAPSVYQLAVEQLRVPANEVCFLSANAWDAAGAARFGFRAVWINRFRQPRERLPFGPEVEIQSLAELPALLGLAS